MWLFAGCNGAGKSTLIASASGPGGVIEDMTILNPDWLTKELLAAQGFHDYVNDPPDIYRRCFTTAADEIMRIAKERVRARESVCIETVLSTPKYLELITVAEERGVLFNFVYVASDRRS